MASNLSPAGNFLAASPVPPPSPKPAGERTLSFPDHLQQANKPAPKAEKLQPARNSEKKPAGDLSKKADGCLSAKGGRKFTAKPILRGADAANPDAEATTDAADPSIGLTTLLAEGELAPDATLAGEKPTKPVAPASADEAPPVIGLAGALGAVLAGGPAVTTQPAADAPSPQPGIDGVNPRLAGPPDPSLFPGDAVAEDASDAAPVSPDGQGATARGTGMANAAASDKNGGKAAVGFLSDESPPLAVPAPNKSASPPPASVVAAPAPVAAAASAPDAPAPKSTNELADDTAATLAAGPTSAFAPAHSNAAGTSQAAAPAPEARFADTNHAGIVSSVRTQLLPHGGTMQIRLDPPELGALQVIVEMRNGSMSATFQTSNDDATRLLSHSLGQLKTALESQGVTVDKIQVQQSPRDQHAPGGEDRQSQGSPQEQQQARQDQQRKEMLQRMWRKLSLGSDPIDMVA